MKKYPYVPADLVRSVNGVLDKRQNVIEQDLRERYQLDEMMSRSLPTPTEEDIHRQLGSEDQIMFNSLVTGYPQHAKSWLAKNASHQNAKAVADILQRNSMFEPPVTESPVVGVIKGQLPDDQHMCATKIFSEEFGEGTPVHSMHADADQDGLIEWYDVMFEHGIERVFTADVQVLTEMSHGNHRRKKKKKMSESNSSSEFPDTDAALKNLKASKGSAAADSHFKKQSPQVQRELNRHMRMGKSYTQAVMDVAKPGHTLNKQITKYTPPSVDFSSLPTNTGPSREEMQKRDRALSKESMDESMNPKAKIIAASMERNKKVSPERRKEIIAASKERNEKRSKNLRMEAKEEPTFDIEKSLPTNAHRSGYQVAIKSTKKADLKQAISQAVEHPDFKKKMLGALSKKQNADQVLNIAADFLETQKTGPSKPKRYSFMDKDEPVVKENLITSVIKRLKESQGMLPPGDINLALHDGYKYRDGWKVVANDNSDEDRNAHSFTFQRKAASGKTHVVQLPSNVKTVGHLMQHLETNPEVATHTPPASGDGAHTITRSNLFQAVAFDRS